MTVRRRGYTTHIILLDRLDPSHMSADETDGGAAKSHPPVFRIIIAEWQSMELRNFLWQLDEMYRQDWANPIRTRASPGNPPRHRVLRLDSRSETGAVPKGLWRNCYNPIWLASLMAYQREELDIIDEDYDFSL